MPIEDQQTQQLGYLLIARSRGEALVIDPPCNEVELMLALLAEHGVRLRLVLRTHAHHADECDPTRLCERSGACLVLGRGTRMAGPCSRESTSVGKGSVLEMGGERLHVLETPGHTPGCVSYLWRDRLFCGDAFDLGSCAAGTEAEPGRLYDSLTRCIFALPEETLVFPAHPIKGRRVALLSELRRRYAPTLALGREEFITEMSCIRPNGSPSRSHQAPPQ